jgi:hypothetical protein
VIEDVGRRRGVDGRGKLDEKGRERLDEKGRERLIGDKSEGREEMKEMNI